MNFAVRISPIQVFNVLKVTSKRNFTHRPLSRNCCCFEKLLVFQHLKPSSSFRFSTENHKDKNPKNEVIKPGLIQKFKQMYKDYWYVLVPVHVITSVFWFGGFYYTVVSGVDVLAIVESLGVSEKLVNPLRDSSAGHLALTYALYKIATPLRYATTVGGTTYAIKRLTDIGWIKPVPSKERMKEIIQVKKENFQDRIKEGKIMYQNQVKQKQNQVMEEMRRYKTEIQNLKDKVKKM